MNRILYTSPYVPAEWIAAHGLAPSRVMPADPRGGSPAWDRQGVCPYVRAFASEAMASQDASGIVMTTVCDQMRRAYDGVAGGARCPAFLMDVPSTWSSATARRLYVDELHRLGSFLVSLGGHRPSNERLADVMRSFDDARTRLRDMQGRVSARQWAQAAEEFGRTGRMPTAEAPPAPSTTRGVPLTLVGGPLCREDLVLYDEIEESGGIVALDLTETGLRGLCRRFDRRAMVEDDPLLELADAYFDGIQDVSRRPNHPFYEWLAQTLKGSDIHGLIVHRFVWCDLWHAEVDCLRRRTGLPVLDLDTDGDQTSSGPRRATRICAFLEMLR